eukprot:TRINITY_DN4043_c0_g1_i1.p1 TRINITY_DN4043_c0_g1~~TRINITY_DN4043_c0_g1_i1.p1  ORF type:complete len:611 (-),score=91.06 TRINITY_DN4043_c0_g1_i1:201-2033(-)
MRKTDSLPALDVDRGRGLADIKGWDPMDRRVEVEKKERYAQDLRDQMARNALKSKNRDDSPSGSSHFGHGGGSGSSRGRGGSVSHMDPSPLTSPGRGGSEISPLRMYPPELPGSSSCLRMADSGLGGARSSGSSTPLLGVGGDANRMTAEKLAQVQESMRQRLQSLQEEQHRQWQRIQDQLQNHLGLARDSAEQAMHKQMESALDAQLRPLLGDLSAARRDCEAQSQRVAAMVGDLESLRRTVERLQSNGEEHTVQLQGHTSEIERLWAAHQECARFRHEMQRDLCSVQESIAHVRAEQDGLSARVADVMRTSSQHSSDIDHLQRAHEDCVRFRAEVQQEHRSLQDALARMRAEQDGLSQRVADVIRTVGQHSSDVDHLKRAQEDNLRFRNEVQQEHRGLHDALSRLRAEQEGLSQRVAEVPAQIKRLREEVSRIAASERMRPPPAPAPVAQPVVVSLPPVSEEAYAVLKNAEGEQYELPALKNVVGRSPACSAVITHSQAISNRHASVDFDGNGQVSVKDLSSRNGTFLNERRVPAETGVVIESGDAIQLGVDGPSYVFEFGPAYYARWPSNQIRVSEARRPSQGPGSSPSSRGAPQRGSAVRSSSRTR